MLENQPMGQVQPIGETVSVLIDHVHRKPNFFPWFRDALPHLFSAQAHGESIGPAVVYCQTRNPADVAMGSKNARCWNLSRRAMTAGQISFNLPP